MVHNDEYRVRCIEKCIEPDELAKLLTKWDNFYVHDIAHIKNAIMNMNTRPESENLIHALFEKLLNYPQVETETLNIIRFYARYLHNSIQYRIKNTPFFCKVTAPTVVACYLADPSPDHELCENIIIQSFVDEVMDLRIPCEFAWGVTRWIGRNFKSVLGGSDRTLACNFDDVEDKQTYFNTAMEFHHFVQSFKHNDEQLLALLKDFYIDFEKYGRSDDEASSIIARVSPYFDAENYDFTDSSYDLYYAMRRFFDEDFSSDDMRRNALNMASDAICRAVYRLKATYKTEKSPDDFIVYARLILNELYQIACLHASAEGKSVHEGDLLLPRFQNILMGTVDYRTTRPNPYFLEEEPPEESSDSIATEARYSGSAKLQSAQAKIYHAYKNYKNAEQKVDSQITKMTMAAKKLAIGDARTEIIEGKRFSAIGLLKKALATAAIFSFGPIKGLIALVIRYALKKSTTQSERKKILLEMQIELDMVNEKIEDARGDSNRKAKYALMRTKSELEAAIGKIKYGIEVDERSLAGAKNALSRRIGGK